MTVRIPALVLILLVAGLQYRLWVGQGSLAEASRYHDLIEAQRGENIALAARNRALNAQVLDLKQGLAAVEELARSELGMVRDGEVFYQVVER